MSFPDQESQLRKGLLELAVLLVIGPGPVYASDILKGLEARDLLVVEGTLYPLLSRLKNENKITYEWQESKNGPPRKYYVLTKEGSQTLTSLVKTWQKLNLSINSLIKKSL